MATRKVYQRIAELSVAMDNCIKSQNLEWLEKHGDRLVAIVKEFLPSGSGFDSGTNFDALNSSSERLVFHTSFHHMDESGGYDGYSEHSVIVTPSLAFGFHLRVTGRDKRQIKEYIGEVFHSALSNEVTE